MDGYHACMQADSGHVQREAVTEAILCHGPQPRGEQCKGAANAVMLAGSLFITALPAALGTLPCAWQRSASNRLDLGVPAARNNNNSGSKQASHKFGQGCWSASVCCCELHAPQYAPYYSSTGELGSA